MARTKGDTSKARAAKASAKTSPKPVAKRVGRKRKADSNPFDDPPDAGQASILSFAAAASQPSHADAIEQDASQPKNDSDDPTTRDPPSDPLLSHAPTDVPSTSTLPSSTDGPHDSVDDGGHQKMTVDHTDIPSAFKDVARGTGIDLLEIVRKSKTIAEQQLADSDDAWKMALSEFLLSTEEVELESLIGQCKQHHLFNAHVEAIRSENGLDEGEWNFGDPEGDMKEDLECCIVWLAAKDNSTNPDAVESGGISTVDTTDIHEDHVLPTVPLGATSMPCDEADQCAEHAQAVDTNANVPTETECVSSRLQVQVTHFLNTQAMPDPARTEHLRALIQVFDSFDNAHQSDTVQENKNRLQTFLKAEESDTAAALAFAPDRDLDLLNRTTYMKIMAEKLSSVEKKDDDLDGKSYEQQVIDILDVDQSGYFKGFSDESLQLADSQHPDSVPDAPIPDISPEDIMCSYAQAMAARAMDVQGTKERFANSPRLWEIASTCTGCGTFELAFQAVADALSTHLPVSDNILEVKLLLACESEKWKQQNLINQVLDRDVCLFADVTCISNDAERKCIVHNRPCDLPATIFCLGSGFSCKSLSKLQNEGTLFRKAMADKNQDSSSFRTFDGTMHLVRSSSPLWFVMENVDMGDVSEEDSNGSVIGSVMAEAGFETRMILLRSDQFGLPQRRTRLFILGVNRRRAASELQNTPEEVLDQAIHTYLPKFKTTPPPVDAFLEDESCGFVQDELNRRQKVRHDRAKRQAQDAPEELDLDSSLRGGKWKEMHMSMAASMGLQWPVSIPEELAENPWFKTLPHREQEIVTFVELKNKEKMVNGESLIRFADLYHSAHRTPTSTRDVVPTVLPSGTVWDFEKNRLMTGTEQLALQGIQFEDNSQLTNNQQQDLAGNAFPSTIMIALQIAMICSMQYPSASDDQTMDSIQAVLDRLV